VTNQWVVTYKIESKSNGGFGVAEFFRGSEEECRRIKMAFAGGESDLVSTNPWGVVIGPADDWDNFLLDARIDTI